MSENNSAGLFAPQPALKKNQSSATMTTTTDSSTLAPSVDNMDNTREKSLNDHTTEPVPRSPTPDLNEKLENAENADNNSDGSEDESNYPGPLALSLITMALSLAVFLVALVCVFSVPCFVRRLTLA
jgi:hypothetical protein